MITSNAAIKHRYVRLVIYQQLKWSLLTGATKAGCTQFFIDTAERGILPSPEMSSNTTPAPFVATSSHELDATNAARQAFRGLSMGTVSGWKSVHPPTGGAVGWLDIDLGERYTIRGFCVGASHDGSNYTFANIFDVLAHNGALGTSLTMSDYSTLVSGERGARRIYANNALWSWVNPNTRAQQLADLAAGRTNHVGAGICAQKGARCAHVIRPTRNMIRVDVTGPESGTALVVDQFQYRDGGTWRTAQSTSNASPLGYACAATVETQPAYAAWQTGPTSGWYIADTSGVSQTWVGNVPLNIALDGLRITCPATGWNRAPSIFSVAQWDGLQWATVFANTTPLTWTSARETKEFVW